MKTFKNLFSVLMIAVLLFSGELFSQSFYTGGVGVTLNDYGRIRIFSDNLTTRQVDRSSILVGVSQSAVFDYTEDAENIVPPTTVINPLFSDYEATVGIDNSYNGQFFPPQVEVDEHIYGWNSGAYLVGKLSVKNNETTPINAAIGLEIIPQVDGDYGFENVYYDAASQIVMMNKIEHVGYKIFSEDITSMHSFDWFDGYNNDADFYAWLTQNSFDPPLTAGVDGSVVVFGQIIVNINPGETYDFYFGVSLGNDDNEVISNMATAEDKYLNSILPVELISFTATLENNFVNLNWTTATELNNNIFEVERKIVDGKNNTDWVKIGYREGYGTTSDQHEYFYSDNVSALTASKVQYRLKQIDFNGSFEYSNIVEVVLLPVDLKLSQNYPNPFNPGTTISFEIPSKDFVVLKIFNLNGEEVSTLIKSELDGGRYNVDFNASNLPSGIYVYTLSTSQMHLSNKMTLLK